jgi:hypothetical protein
VRRANFSTIKNPFSPSHSRSSFTPRVSTYPAVQICGATSEIPFLLLSWGQVASAVYPRCQMI